MLLMSVWQTGQVFMPVYQARNSMRQPGTNICWRVGSIVWRSIVGSSQGFVGRILMRGVVWRSWFGVPSLGSRADIRGRCIARHRANICLPQRLQCIAGMCALACHAVSVWNT